MRNVEPNSTKRTRHVTFHRILYMYLHRREHKQKQDALQHNYRQAEKKFRMHLRSTEQRQGAKAQGIDDYKSLQSKRIT